MKAIAAFVLSVAAAAAPSVYAQEAPQIAPATEAATRWLAVMDAGKAAEAWDAGAPVMQSAITRDMWNKVGTDARAPLGAVKSRKQTSANFTKTLPGVPDGEYVVIQYATDFANRAGVIETVVPMRLPDGSWKVTTYLIR
ncbi:DUF4019 domain-containing protein [Massilia sp. YIM B02769]|uniref:DUF4019 domain-containing protein n=1 Tax=unclassified Massilia TaxID=2609279 RepID=UPI0025B67F02|nr:MULTISPECIES: DUF4019 domain-containing protein [unclassified Massilia]MDN4058138.1 DUF4019 domain-containing protein [Massilia sp. YIM B02769]